jgi:phage shock protein PspC (stress-responsive transcriptional regulator)
MSFSDSSTEHVRRLTRSRENRIFLGVCGGIARYFDIDPVIPRVILAVLAIFGGAGIFIYAIAWLLMPDDGSPSTRLEGWLEARGGDRVREAVIVVIALFAVAFLLDDNHHHFAHRITGAALVILVVMTVVALVGRRRVDRSATAAPRAAAVDPTAGSPTAPFGPTAVPYGPAAAPGAEAAATAAWQVATPRARRPRSWLGWLTFAATLLVAGTFSIVAAAGWAHPQPADVLAACVAVVAIGLLVGSVFGRAWAMIPLGIVLVGCLAAANALPRNLTWTAGNRFWTPQTAGAHPAYVLGAGDAQLDLSQLPAHLPATVTSRVGAGRLLVLVPVGTAVNVHATSSAGRVEVFGHEQDGTGVEVRQSTRGIGAHPRTVTLDLQMGYGDVEVRSEAA